jgi:hypothetical protein
MGSRCSCSLAEADRTKRHQHEWHRCLLLQTQCLSGPSPGKGALRQAHRRQAQGRWGWPDRSQVHGARARAAIRETTVKAVGGRPRKLHRCLYPVAPCWSPRVCPAGVTRGRAANPVCPVESFLLRRARRPGSVASPSRRLSWLSRDRPPACAGVIVRAVARQRLSDEGYWGGPSPDIYRSE